MTTYLLDSNIFIQAKNLHYGLDFCPAFWQWLDEAHAAGTVCSIDSVRTELIAGNDDLSAWVQQRPSTFFISPSASTVPSLQTTSRRGQGWKRRLAGSEPTSCGREGGSAGEAGRQFGDPVGPVLLAHPAGAFEQAHAVQGAPQQFGRRAVVFIAERGPQRVEAGPQF